MNKYIFYIEFYGKKLKVKIEAESIIEGKKVIKEKIIFHKIEKEDNNKYKNTDIFEQMFGGVFK